MTEHNITLLTGDGIGPEITNSVKEIFKEAGLKINWDEQTAGAYAIETDGEPLPQRVIESIKKNKVALKAPVTTPIGKGFRSVNVLLRKTLDLYSNLRPAVLNPQLKAASPLKNSKLENGLDIMVVRELTGGIYFGKHELAADGSWASDEERYSVKEIERIGRIAFNTARLRGKKLTSIDKANVLESSRLWRKTMTTLSTEYPDVELLHMYVDMHQILW